VDWFSNLVNREINLSVSEKARNFGTSWATTLPVSEE
jgi:hypothetical protein